MNIVGQVESVWRYPVKSLRGESLPEFLQVLQEFIKTGFFFKSAAAPARVSFYRTRTPRMLLYQPRSGLRNGPPTPQNLAEAEVLLLASTSNPVGAAPRPSR